jgi:mono/diheme cytochrome c family protein
MKKFVAVCLVILAGVVSLAGADEEKAKRPVGDVERGKGVFFSVCGECHEAYSREEKVGPGLAGIKNGQLPTGRKATHDRLLDVVNDGPAEMPKLKDRLTEQEKEDVVAFVLTL